MTRTQALTLRYIRWHWWRYGCSPSRQELADGFGLTRHGVYARLCRLEQDGYIKFCGAGVVPVESPHAKAA